jgi:hypothetical protein
VVRRTALWLGLVAGFGAVGGLVAKYSRNPDADPLPPPVPPPPPPWEPVGWAAKPGGKIVTLPDGRTLHERLYRQYPGEELVAILITKARDTDPPPFYMLRDKVTARVFKALWDDAEKRQDSAVNRYRKKLPAENPGEVQRHLPDAWTFLPHEPATRRMAFDATPVLGVNAVQAILAAEELRGKLPTYDQWLKAVGIYDDDPESPGPAGPQETSMQENLTLRTPPLALGLRTGGPWPIDRETKDLSVFKIHQLVSNGLEWSGGDTADKRPNIYAPPSEGFTFRQTGTTYEITYVLTYTRIRTKPEAAEWLRTEDWAGFRVVLEPPPR